MKEKSERPPLTQKKTKNKNNKDFASFCSALLYFELLRSKTKSRSKTKQSKCKTF